MTTRTSRNGCLEVGEGVFAHSPTHSNGITLSLSHFTDGAWPPSLSGAGLALTSPWPPRRTRPLPRPPQLRCSGGRGRSGWGAEPPARAGAADGERRPRPDRRLLRPSSDETHGSDDDDDDASPVAASSFGVAFLFTCEVEEIGKSLATADKFTLA